MNLDRELFIKNIVYGGYGLSEIDGKKVLVRYAAPSEYVKAKVIKEKKDYIEALVDEVVIPSSHRRSAPCKYYQLCGGCQIQHMDYQSQLDSKVSILKDSLERLGKIKDYPIIGVLGSPQEFNYRVRAQFKVSSGFLGFFRWGSHEIVNIEECLLLHPAINKAIPALKELSKKLSSLQEIHVIYSPTEDEILIKLVSPTHIEKEKLKKYHQDILPKSVVGLGVYSAMSNGLYKRYVLGREFTYVKVDDTTYRVSQESFFQVNYTLWDSILHEVANHKYRKAMELYCGVGFFSLKLSKNVEYLIASDSNRTAIKDAQYSAKMNSIDNVTFYNEPSFQTLKRHAGEVLDLLVVDPPRGGLSDGEAKLILQNKPTNIVYISCNPSTLARDLKVLTKGGYTIESIKLLDNFPQTYHVESIVKLRLS